MRLFIAWSKTRWLQEHIETLIAIHMNTLYGIFMDGSCKVSAKTANAMLKI